MGRTTRNASKIPLPLLLPLVLVAATATTATTATTAHADQHDRTPAPATAPATTPATDTSADVDTTIQPDAPQYPVLEDVTTWRPTGISFAVGGGVGGYIDSPLTDRSNGTATAYDVRGVFGTRARAAIELAHFGVVQRFELDRVDDVRLLTMGIETAARVNLNIGDFQPYLLGGIGWTHANLLGQAGESASADDRKNLVHFPVGGGMALYFGEFVLDVRGQIRLTSEEENRLFVDIDSGGLSTWAATAQIGWHP